MKSVPQSPAELKGARCRSAGGPAAEAFTRVLLPEAQGGGSLARLQSFLQDVRRG